MIVVTCTNILLIIVPPDDFQKKKQKVGINAFHTIILKMGVIMSSASFIAYSKGYALPLTLHVEQACPEKLLLFKSKSVIGSCVHFA